MAWCFDDEAGPAADSVLQRLRDEPAAVPSIWSLEVANVMLVAERRRRLTEAQVSRFLDLLQQLPIQVEEVAADLGSVVAAGRRHNLSAYDAAYLVLAERVAAPLATLDRRLAHAATRAGVKLLVAADLS